MTKIELIAFDLDGTVLPMGSQYLLESFCKAAEQAAATGVQLAIFTGRSVSTIPPEAMALTGLRYICYANGAGILDTKTGQNIYQDLMPEETCLQVLEALEQLQVVTQVFANDTIVFPRDAYEDENFHFPNHHMRSMQSGHGLVVDNLIAYVRSEHPPVDKINVPQAVGAQRDELFAMLLGIPTVTPLSSGGINIEINTKSTSKGGALQWLTQYLEIPMAAVMAMGDNDNDITMLAAAGLGVAVANATAGALAVANYVTAAAEENGAAVAIEKFVLQQNMANV